MTEQQNIPTFKLVLVGDGGTGKVTNSLSFSLCTAYWLSFVRPPLSNDILPANLRRNTSQLSVLKVCYLHHRPFWDALLMKTVHPITFHTNFGQICFNTWDTAGQEKFGGLRDGYYIGGIIRRNRQFNSQDNVVSLCLTWLPGSRTRTSLTGTVCVWLNQLLIT